jgi:hypothetical protein
MIGNLAIGTLLILTGRHYWRRVRNRRS